MKIIYLANLTSKLEQHKNTNDILYALKKLGHDVTVIDDQNFTEEDIFKVKDPDLFLFHKGGMIDEDGQGVDFHIQRLIGILAKLKCRKVFWFLDKVWDERVRYIYQIMPFVDAGFMTDGTFIRRHNYHKLYDLKQGFRNHDDGYGDYQKKYDCDIAHIGTIYGARKPFIAALSREYGDRFRPYTNIWDRDFFDLCESAKIIVASKYPADDFYWSDRIYTVLGARGFLIHPRLHGLKKEFVEGKHYIGYACWEELVSSINYFLDPKMDHLRTRIAQEGSDHVRSNYTYLDRLKKMFEIVENL